MAVDNIHGRIDNIREQEKEKDEKKEAENDFKRSDCGGKRAPGKEVCQLQQTSEGDK